MIFETDAPYLTPKPFRGTMNKPGYVKYIAEWATEYYKVDFGTVAKITTENAEKIFKI
jgi:TatD DNase family protein